MANIRIEYDGKWPCLCHGRLKVWIDDVLWDFSEHALISGGEVVHDGYFNDWEVHYDKWSIDDYSYPKDFPEDMKKAVTDAINTNIPWGCCGGCI